MIISINNDIWMVCLIAQSRYFKENVGLFVNVYEARYEARYAKISEV